MDNIYGWQGYRFTSGDLAIGIVPQVGGRIMSLTFKGQELFFVDPHLKGSIPNISGSDYLTVKKSLGFPLWGGHKTWIAPESEWALKMPPIDLDSCPYQFSYEKEKVTLTSPICRETGLQIIRRIAMKNQQLFIEEELINKSDFPVKRGIWSVAQLLRPCIVRIPCQADQIRSYHHTDKTLPVINDVLPYIDGCAQVKCVDDQLFKFGAMINKGEVAVSVGHGTAINFSISFDYDLKQPYAHDSIVEVFNACAYPYTEVEIHSPIKTLLINESIILKQVWSF